MSRPHIATASELSTLRDLEFVARTTVEGLRHGLHRSPFHGYSAEFSQYRHYRPGDDLRHVDWKLFARTDRFYTRQFRETTNLHALFVVDVSRSMDYGDKFALARRITAVLGTLILDQGDGVGLLAVGDGVRYLPARSGHRHLSAFLRELAFLDASGTAPLSTALARTLGLLKRRGLVIVVSDFYDADALGTMRRLARAGQEVVVIHTLSDDELELPAAGAAEFVDAETGRSVVVQAEAAAAGYESRVKSWLQDLQTAVRREGLDYLRVTTGDDLERALRRFVVSRAEGTTA
jgi:uncharacterized protein (DUF58 family)